VGGARGPVERPRVLPEPRDGRERVGELDPQASCPHSSGGGRERLGFGLGRQRGTPLLLQHGHEGDELDEALNG
jgi:hypothetical protein